MAITRIYSEGKRQLAVQGGVRNAVDIIVPIYKNAILASACINSIAEHLDELTDCRPRLIVINDSPGERDVYQMLKEFADRHSYVILIENERNLGFVESVNKALAIACQSGRDAILINSDTETFAETLRNLAIAAYSDPQIGFASPRSNNASICSLPHLTDGIAADRAEAYERWKLLTRTMPKFHFAPTGVGFYLYIRHAVLANFGFFDTDFGLGYEEENDLILRANKVGYRAVIVNNAFAYHAGSASFNLLDMNLSAHQCANLEKMVQRHAEFLPLVRRYEASAHFRAEVLLSQGLLPVSGRLKVVFDLSAVGPNFNGTNEMGMAIIDGLCQGHSSKFEYHVICSPESFAFHRLDRHDGLRRHDTDQKITERFAVGVFLGQPFNVHSISVLEDLAVINIFGMLDTIGEDCGYLSITHELESVWGHVTRHSNGVFFNSKFSEQCFLARYPDTETLPRYTRLLPTNLRSYPKNCCFPEAEHVLILGNHFAHKGSAATAEILKRAFPATHFVVFGKENSVAANVRTCCAGTLDDTQMQSMYSKASVVVLPSHVEGFGLGLLHALAARRVVVARDIPATREILETYQSVSGVFLYRDDGSLISALESALEQRESEIGDEGADSWDEWVDGFAEYFALLLGRTDIFKRLVSRVQAGDLLRKAEQFDRLRAASLGTNVSAVGGESTITDREVNTLVDAQGRKWLPARHIQELLDMNGREFVCGAYVTLFGRLPDSNGLANYLAELQSGVSKLDIVSRLRESSEGRTNLHALPGYRSTVVRTKLGSALGFSAFNEYFK